MSKKVTFTLPAEIVAGATDGLLLGDFNHWDHSKGEKLKKQKDGSLQAIVSLEPGKTYHYRYFLSDGRWENDYHAEAYSYDPHHNSHNCVITVPAEDKKELKPKVAEKKAAPKKAATEKVAVVKEKAAKKAPAKKAAPAKK